MMRPKVGLAVLALVLIAGVAFAGGQAEGEGGDRGKPDTLTVVWHAGTCADALLDVAQGFEEETGVKVEGSLVPYGPQWHDKIASEFAAQGSGFDLAAWDSQSASEFAGGGHAVQLNPLLQESDMLDADDFSPEMRSRYGEYPDGSGDYYALPVNADSLGMMYRTDLFEDPAEQRAFRQEYGYDLEIPQTYEQLRDMAEFFTRPDEGLYGWGMYGGRQYDYATSSSNSFIWSFGGELWNPDTFEVKGYLDSPASVDGLEVYLDLLQFCPPGVETWGFDEINSAFASGRLAMAQQWFYFFGSMLDPEQSEVHNDVGFGILPGGVGRDGLFRRQFSMGGQGLGINKYTNYPEWSWRFLEWYMQYDQQFEYAKTCQTGRRDVLEDPEWKNLNPYNKLFLPAMEYTNDYWHLPEYAIMLDVMQEEVHNAITGSKTAQQALSDCAERHEQILERAGYDIERTTNVDVPDTQVDPCGQEEVTPVQID